LGNRLTAYLLFISDEVYYAFKEALGSLALNLRYLGTDDTMKVIAFTSSVPSEGKSTLTYNLANILAALGHRVLLIDADMRKPTIHKLARLSNSCYAEA
jgi:Mrp family chromosome partitioning ATPase